MKSVMSSAPDPFRLRRTLTKSAHLVSQQLSDQRMRAAFSSAASELSFCTASAMSDLYRLTHWVDGTETGAKQLATLCENIRNDLRRLLQSTLSSRSGCDFWSAKGLVMPILGLRA